ncbi:hypothetical protein CALVIDRAFT_380108 [Calocera viscosa TUFC12733]|uniref:F-box domain-containing protein n=1 Tax=Calocera viscosa (strain TUFC12733) TaxID=1330018 RepID=A0A167Q4S1_CALVF|nr:hypothetical protein CALVIDRAFT_380108 [Calocera viscosa TUFC12733]
MFHKLRVIAKSLLCLLRVHTRSSLVNVVNILPRVIRLRLDVIMTLEVSRLMVGEMHPRSCCTLLEDGREESAPPSTCAVRSCWNIAFQINVSGCRVSPLQPAAQAVTDFIMLEGKVHTGKALFARLRMNKSHYVPAGSRQGPVALPFEVVQDILWQMRSHEVWTLRPVCKAWQRYIETVIARDWLLNTWIIFEDGRYENQDAKPIFCMCDPRYGVRPPSAWPLVRKDRAWLVYALPRKPTFPEYIPPPSHPNYRYLRSAQVEQARTSARSENPTWANIILDGKIRVVPPRCAVHRSGTIKLYASSHKKVRNGRIIGYDVGLTEVSAFLKIDWRVLFSVMFTPTRTRTTGKVKALGQYLR